MIQLQTASQPLLFIALLLTVLLLVLSTNRVFAWLLPKIFVKPKAQHLLHNHIIRLKPFSVLLVGGMMQLLVATPLFYPVQHWVSPVFKATLVLGLGWLLCVVILFAEELLSNHFRLDVTDNRYQRRVMTQVRFMRRLGMVIIAFIALCILLADYPPARHIGGSLLASAGLIGIVFGFAAQKPITNMFAGLQIAMTQPIKIDDVLIIENEWGRITEMTLTYVVMQLWDKRELVIPNTYFIDTPFQNWSRNRSDLIGVVFLYADYSLDMPVFRDNVEAYVAKHPLWDGDVYVVQVTDCKDLTMEVRILVSAANASEAFDLRCDVREFAVGEMSRQQATPQLRLQGQGPALSRPQGQDNGLINGQEQVVGSLLPSQGVQNSLKQKANGSPQTHVPK